MGSGGDCGNEVADQADISCIPRSWPRRRFTCLFEINQSNVQLWMVGVQAKSMVQRNNCLKKFFYEINDLK